MAYVAKITAGGNSSMLVGSSLYGTCTTAAATAAKVVTMSGFDTLITGVTIHVKFTNSNTAASPTLTVGSAAAKAIKMYGTTAVGTSVPLSWPAGAVVSFTYDGTNWIMNDFSAYNLDASRLTTGTVPAARLPSDYKKIYFITSFTATYSTEVTTGGVTYKQYNVTYTGLPTGTYNIGILFAKACTILTIKWGTSYWTNVVYHSPEPGVSRVAVRSTTEGNNIDFSFSFITTSTETALGYTVADYTPFFGIFM